MAQKSASEYIFGSWKKRAAVVAILPLLVVLVTYPLSGLVCDDNNITCRWSVAGMSAVWSIMYYFAVQMLVMAPLYVATWLGARGLQPAYAAVVAGRVRLTIGLIVLAMIVAGAICISIAPVVYHLYPNL